MDKDYIIEEKDFENIIEEMDKEIQELTGGKPQEFDVNQMFNESQEVQKTLYGGGEDNIFEKKYLEGIREREIEIKKRKKTVTRRSRRSRRT